MGKKKRFVDIEESSDEGSDVDSIDGDSDSDLQKAFASGQLQTGLNEIVALKRVKQDINNRNGLKAKLEQMKLGYDWVETLDSINTPAKVSPDVQQQYGDMNIKVNKKGEMSGEELNSDKSNHDFKREMMFYRQAQSGVLEAIPRLHELGVKTKRPDDYFAEMAKTDDHMKKVRENIVHKQTSLENSEKAKKLRAMKKYGKKIQQEVMLKRQKDKREMMDKLKNYKKGKEDNLDFLENKSKSNSNKKSNDRKPNKTNKKAKYKESKFGFGGQKKRSKYNNSKSSADITGFSRKHNSKPMNKKQRPGKSKRLNIKSKQ